MDITNNKNIIHVKGNLKVWGNCNPLINRTINIKIGNDIMTTQTDANGKFTYSYETTKVGTFDVNATFDGNEYYNGCSQTGSITINKLTTTLTTNSISLKYGKAATITGTLTDENTDAVSGATLTIKVNGGTGQTVTTDTDGSYNYTYTPSAVGTDSITVEYAGGIIYESSNATGSVTVTRLDTSLTVTDISDIKYSHTGTITCKLADENNKAISGGTLTAVVTNSTGTSTTTLSGTTGTDGSCNITIPGTYSVGSYNVTVKYEESSTGNAATVTKTFNVVKLDTSITIDPISAVKVGKTTVITGNLVDEDGKNVAGETVTVTVDDA